LDGDRQQARRLQEERHGKQFEVRFDGELATTPQRVWDAITTSNGTAGWIWPLEYEPPTDGSAPAIPDENGAVTVWEPAARFSARAEGPGGWFNNLDHVLEPTPGGTTLHYVHTGVFDEDGWDNLYDGCSQHTAFYMHTLGQYVRYFAGRTAAYAGIDAPAGSAAPDGFTRVREALGLPADVTAGTRVRLTPDGLAPIEGVVDYLHPNDSVYATDSEPVSV
jgi:uncharacterized protein YndB with AHSA1/START domain